MKILLNNFFLISFNKFLINLNFIYFKYNKYIKKYIENLYSDLNKIFLQATDKHGITTLLAAIWEGHTNCVKLLLEKGAKPDGLTPDGTSYLDAAEKDEIKQLLKFH